MKYLTLLLTALTLSFAAPVFAAEDSKPAQAEQAVQSGDVHVSVNGLVCDFCARALEKVFGKEAAVKAIDVNLDTKIITVNFNEGQTLSDEKITVLVTDAGYNVEGIHRVE
jgi:copper chaperone CopZ